MSTLLCRPQVCKYFLEAIENNKYGWFWVCPAGGDSCMYRHALPPGFVLKKDKKKEEKEEEISLEELVENEVRMERWRREVNTVEKNLRKPGAAGSALPLEAVTLYIITVKQMK